MCKLNFVTLYFIRLTVVPMKTEFFCGRKRKKHKLSLQSLNENLMKH